MMSLNLDWALPMPCICCAAGGDEGNVGQPLCALSFCELWFTLYRGRFSFVRGLANCIRVFRFDCTTPASSDALSGSSHKNLLRFNISDRGIFPWLFAFLFVKKKHLQASECRINSVSPS